MLMRLLVASGQRDAAPHQYEQCRQILRRELDTQTTIETEMLYASIKADKQPQGDGRVQETASVVWDGTAAARGRRPTNLPQPTLPLIGRTALLHHVVETARQGKSRLVTLTGLGGVGKSALALHVGLALLDAYPDGVWRISLQAGSLIDQLADFG